MLNIKNIYNLFLVSVVGITIADSNTTQTYIAPVYKLNLDEPASDRWINIFNDTITKHGWQYTYEPLLDYVEKILPFETWYRYDKIITGIVAPLVGNEITSEIFSLIQLFRKYRKNVTVSQMLSFQVFYEILMQCTGAIVREDNSSVLHGRNLDIGLNVKNIIATVLWYRNNTEIIRSTQFLGYMGIHTGMRVRKWSVQANMRVVLTPGPIIGYKYQIVLQDVMALLEGNPPVGNFLRYSLINYDTYETAVDNFKHKPLASSMYLIVGGSNTGVTITRDRKGLAKESSDTSIFGKDLPMPRPIKNMSDSFLVQTNWDPWVSKTRTDCINSMNLLSTAELKECHTYIKIVYGANKTCFDLCQLYSDGRCEFAKTMLDRITSDYNYINSNQLLGVLSTPPVRQAITQFTAIMSISRNIYNTWIHDSNFIDDNTSIKSLQFFIKNLLKIY